MNRDINQFIAAFIASGVIATFPLIGHSAPEQNSIIQIGNTVIPQAFGNALRDGMRVPLFIHLNDNQNKDSDLRIGNAFIWLDGGKLIIRTVELEDNNDNSLLNDDTRKKLTSLTEQSFNDELKIPVSAGSQLQLDLKQLNLQLVIDKSALGTIMQTRSQDIGASSVNQLSSTLNYNLGVYNNRAGNGSNNTSSYLSLDNITAFLEHHIILNGSLYGIGSGQSNGTLYKALYERDYAGYRVAVGLLDSWNLQSLGPVTAIPAGKILGFSFGNQASSTVFDNAQSITPVVVFLPAAGEVYLYREGRLLSIQNFDMGNHEIDTRGLPYGTYDIDVDVMVNSKIIDKRTQRINKLFSQRGNNASPSWQVWGGKLKMERWQSGKNNVTGTTEKATYDAAKDTALIGISGTGSFGVFSWAATIYGYDKNAVAETQFTLPVTDKITINLQNMAANDGSSSSLANINASLPGDFSSIWVTREKTHIGDHLRRNDIDNLSIGGSINLSAAWSPLGTLTTSYNKDNRNANSYYNIDYNQNLYSGGWGNLSMRTGVQHYSDSSNNNAGKYIAFDFSLPLGNWFSAGMTHQRGYTMANVSARKHFDDGTIRSVGVNASRAVFGDTGSDKTLSGGGYAQFETRYSNGTVNINSGTDGHINTNLTANGAVGWNGGNIAASGMYDGNSGIIFNADIDNDGSLSADVNGRRLELKNGRNYLPLSSYAQYDVEITNSKKSTASYNISGGRKTKLTLYPGNVAVITPEIKQMVTVFGRIKAEDGTLIANAHINNHIGRTKTNNSGEFVMDIDKNFPTIDFAYGKNQSCEIELNLTESQGAIWVGDVTCTGLKTYAKIESVENNYEG